MNDTKQPDLIEAARAFIEYEKTCEADDYLSWDEHWDAIAAAIAALPPDAVIVSAGLLREAADAIYVYGTAQPERQMEIAAGLRAAAGGGG